MPELMPTKSMKSMKAIVTKIVEEEDNEAFDWDH